MSEPESTDAGAMMRRAQAAGVQLETYDPNVLALDLQEFLRQKGLHPDATGRTGMVTAAAGQLLRAFGIVPAADYTTIDRRNAPDADSR